MALILNIETATPVCSVSLSENGVIISHKEINSRNSHSSVITLFIEEVMEKAGKVYADLDAVAVSKGPGSYTGLRIGVSTAKGICFATDKPLISISTLQAMGFGLAQIYSERPGADNNAIFVPMIDARRMEVYTAQYTLGNDEIVPVEAKIIDEESFKEELENKTLVFGGDGAEKCKEIISSSNAIFIENFHPSSTFMAKLAEYKFQQEDFEDVAYFEPYYLKDFVAGIPKVKGLR